MKYLVNLNKINSKAHLWDEGDTWCKMLSTGGLNKKKYKVTDLSMNKDVCSLCEAAWKNFNECTRDAYFEREL